MGTAEIGSRRSGPAGLWWRPVAFSAAAAAAIGTLFNPLPGYAAPPAAPPAAPISVPDAGSRPVLNGAITLPGQRPATTPATPTTIPGSATNPILQKIEQGRAEIATMGDQLIQLGKDRDLARTQAQNANDAYDAAEKAMTKARSDVDSAAADAFMQAAAMPPGAVDSGLGGLSELAQLQHGDTDSSEIAALQLQNAEITAQLALNQKNAAAKNATTLAGRYDKLQVQLTHRQSAQQTLETRNAGLLAAAEQSENAADTQLGNNYLGGPNQGQGADPRAITALTFALAQRGKPYVWSEEGPDFYDCSGLMWASYREAGFQLERVSRDQYWQTRDKVVDRYSLVPGDLLFFSYTNSWTGIHHVAMYAGNGMMVEAPRSGLNVRLVPVRWSRLFQATRVFGSVPGGVTAPPIGAPDPDSDNVDPTTAPTTPATTSPTTPRTSRPATPRPTNSSTPPANPSHSASPSHPTNPIPSGSTSNPPPSGTPTSGAASKPPPSGTPSETATSGAASKPPPSDTPTGAATSSSASKPPSGGAATSSATGKPPSDDTPNGAATSSATGKPSSPSGHASSAAAGTSSSATHQPTASTSSGRSASATVSATASTGK